jgi:hypothetical protein
MSVAVRADVDVRSSEVLPIVSVCGVFEEDACLVSLRYHLFNVPAQLVCPRIALDIMPLLLSACPARCIRRFLFLVGG